jgi:hypothetical protein
MLVIQPSIWIEKNFLIIFSLLEFFMPIINDIVVNIVTI